MKVYAVTGIWDTYTVIGMSLNKKVAEKALEKIKKQSRDHITYYDPLLKVEEFELSDNFLVFN